MCWIFIGLSYSPCAALLAGIPPGGLGLSRLVHEKAHPNTSISLYNLLLKALMLVALIASWPNWFHLLITLLEKKCLLLSRVHLLITTGNWHWKAAVKVVWQSDNPFLRRRLVDRERMRPRDNSALSFLHCFARWRGGATGKAFGLAISRSRVQILLEATLRNNLRQVV